MPTSPVSDLMIGSVQIPNDESAHALSVRVEVDTTASYRVRGNGALEKLTGPRYGKRRITITATGPYPPALAAVDWRAAVSITFTDLALDDGATTLSVLSDGPSADMDIRQVVTGWSLTGREV